MKNNKDLNNKYEKYKEKIAGIIFLSFGIFFSYSIIENVIENHFNNFLELFSLLLSIPFILVGIFLIKFDSKEEKSIIISDYEKKYPLEKDTIQNSNFKSTKDGIIIAFLVVATIFIIGIIMGIHIEQKEMCTEATVTMVEKENSLTYKVYAEYPYNDSKKEVILNHYKKYVKEGDIIKINCSPKKKLVINLNEKFLEIVLMFLFPLSIIAVRLLKKNRRKVQQKKYEEKKENLLKNGKEITATIKKIKKDFITGTSYFISCYWKEPVTNKNYYFKSKQLYFNPSKYIEKKEVQEIKVYISQENPKEYIVYTDDIEQEENNFHIKYHEIIDNYKNKIISQEDFYHQIEELEKENN